MTSKTNEGLGRLSFHERLKTRTPKLCRGRVFMWIRGKYLRLTILYTKVIIEIYFCSIFYVLESGTSGKCYVVRF